MAIKKNNNPFITDQPSLAHEEVRKYQKSHTSLKDFTEVFWVYQVMINDGTNPTEIISDFDNFKRKIKTASGSITFELDLATMVKPIIPISPDIIRREVEVGDTLDKQVFGTVNYQLKTKEQFDTFSNTLYIVSDKNLLLNTELDPTDPNFGKVLPETNIMVVSSIEKKVIKGSGMYDHTVLHCKKINRFIPDKDLDLFFSLINIQPNNVKKIRLYFEGNTNLFTYRALDTLSNQYDAKSIKIMKYSDDKTLVEDTSFNEPLKTLNVISGNSFETEHPDVGEYDFSIDVANNVDAVFEKTMVEAKVGKNTTNEDGYLDIAQGFSEWWSADWKDCMPNTQYSSIMKGSHMCFDKDFPDNFFEAIAGHAFSDLLSITSGTYPAGTGSLYDEWPDKVPTTQAIFPPYNTENERWKNKSAHFYKKDFGYANSADCKVPPNAIAISEPIINISFDSDVRKEVMLSIINGVPTFLGHNYLKDYPDFLENDLLPTLDGGGYGNFAGNFWLTLLSVRDGVAGLSKEMGTVGKEPNRGERITVQVGTDLAEVRYEVPNKAFYFINRLRESWYDQQIGKVFVDTNERKVFRKADDPWVVEIEYDTPISEIAKSELFALTKNKIIIEFLDENDEWPKATNAMYQKVIKNVKEHLSIDSKDEKFILNEVIKYYEKEGDKAMVNYLKANIEIPVFPIIKQPNNQSGQPLKLVYRDQWA